MSEAIVVALITGGLSLAGVVITCLATAKKTEKATAVAQAVTDTKLEELTREVREHNHFATRMPALEQRVDSLEHRVDHLELYHKAPIN
jgi:outer membrane murein-binding lipoprotein Lpp